MPRTHHSSISKAGFTLVEILAAIGISSAVLLTTFTVAVTAYKSFQETSDAIIVSETLSRAAAALTRNLTFAASIRLVTSSIPNSISAGDGQILEGSWASGFAGGFVTVAAYRRDSGAGIANAAGPQTVLRPTGIFYLRPTPQTSGILFIDVGNGASNNVTPSYANPFYDRLTELIVDSPQLSNGKLTGIRIIMKARFFLNADRSLWRWCPASETSASCQTVTYKDVTRTVYISFVNQILNPEVYWNTDPNRPPERVSGLLYFFPLR